MSEGVERSEEDNKGELEIKNRYLAATPDPELEVYSSRVKTSPSGVSETDAALELHI